MGMSSIWGTDPDPRPNSHSVQMLLAASINMGARPTSIDWLVRIPQNAVCMVCLSRAITGMAPHGTITGGGGAVLSPDDHLAPNRLI